MIKSTMDRHMHKTLAPQSAPGLPVLAILLLLMVFAAPSLQAHPAFNIRRGLEALQGGDLEQAETELQRARFAAPANPIVSYNLGVVSYRRRDYQKAAGFFMQAASAAGADEQMKFDSLYNLGNSAFKAGDFAAAVSAYSGSIEVKADEQAKYNLEVARKKLLEQQEKQQQQNEQNEQNNQEKDKNKPKQDQQKQDQKGQQDKSDQKSGDQSGQQGDQPESQENQKDQNAKNDQQNQQGQDQQDQQNASGKDSESENEKQQKNDQQQAEQKSGEESDQQKADESSSGQEDQNASQTQQLQEQAAVDPSENREDVEMADGDAQQQEPQKPDASQRARALKNVRLNPYQVERLLQQMQERERQAQLYYRNEPQRTDEADPFNMNAQELHEWFENRNRRRPQSPADEPDW